MEFKYRYTYIITCTSPEMYGYYYCGQHSTNNLNDHYHGSGKLIKQYFKEHPNEYIKQIVKYCNSQEELNKAELELIESNIDNPLCLNIYKQGAAHSHTLATREQIALSNTNKTHSVETRQLLSKKRKEYYKEHDNWNKGLKGVYVPTEETKQKQSQSLKEYYSVHDSHLKGTKRSDDARRKQSESLKGKSKTEKHKHNISESLKGKSKSKEHRQHLSESLKGKETWNKGYKKLNDGYVEVYVSPDYWGEFIDIGFTFGRLKR